MGSVKLLYEDKYEIIVYNTNNVKQALELVFKYYKQFEVINSDDYITKLIQLRKLDINKCKLLTTSIAIIDDLTLIDEVNI